MWTETTRVKYESKSGRYASDVTDQEWQCIKPLIERDYRRGRPRKWPLRDIVDALFDILRSGCSWRLLPKEFPPMTTVQPYFLSMA